MKYDSEDCDRVLYDKSMVGPLPMCIREHLVCFGRGLLRLDVRIRTGVRPGVELEVVML